MRALVSSALIMLGLVSCARHAEGPIVLIGADGLEWATALPLVRAGRMPALESLMARGSFGTLSTRAPAKSPVIWTTVATGKEPEKHGIADFTVLSDDGSRRLYTAADRETKALWDILGDAGRETAVIGWWTTYPAEPIAGVMIAQANTLERTSRRRLLKPGGLAAGAPRQVYPPSLEAEVVATVETVERDLPALLDTLVPTGPTDDPSDRANRETVRWSLRADESTRRLALELLRSGNRFDLVLAYFGSTDVVGHRFWRFHRPGAFRHPPSEERIEKLGEVVNRTYEYFDRILGDLVATLPDDATIFVVSDHGMRPKRVNATFEPVDDPFEPESGGHGAGPPGLLVVAGPSIRASLADRRSERLDLEDMQQIGDVADITPTILALQGLPIGRDMDGEVLEGLLAPEALANLAPSYVSTHDTPGWSAGRDELATELPGVTERIEQLRSLGYLDDSGDE